MDWKRRAKPIQCKLREIKPILINKVCNTNSNDIF